MKKRILATLMALCLAVGLLPMPAAAANDPGSHGDHTGYTEWTSTDSLPAAGGTYYLSGDVTISADWAVAGTTQLCLNGCNINLNTYQILVNKGTELILCDCSTEVTEGYLEKKNSEYQLWRPGTGGGEPCDLTGGVIYGGVFDGDEELGLAAGIQVNGGRLVLSDGNIAGNYNLNSDGGGVSVRGGGTFEMYGGAIAGNSTQDGPHYGRGGGLYGRHATIYLYGGEIHHNYTGRKGGGIYLFGGEDDPTYLTLDGAVICDNVADPNGSAGEGGGIAARDADGVTIKSGRIERNAAREGGGLSFYTVVGNGKLSIEGGTIQNNKASGYPDPEYDAYAYGGGICVAGEGQFEMTGGEVIGNTSAGRGGGVALRGTCADIEAEAVIGDNIAAVAGAALYYQANYNSVSHTLQFATPGFREGTLYYWYDDKENDRYQEGDSTPYSSGISGTWTKEDSENLYLIVEPGETSGDVPAGTITGNTDITLHDPVTEGPNETTLTVELNNEETLTEPVAYQWQTWNGSAWEAVPGETGVSLTLTGLTEDDDGTEYRCLVTTGGSRGAILGTVELNVEKGSQNAPNVSHSDPAVAGGTGTIGVDDPKLTVGMEISTDGIHYTLVTADQAANGITGIPGGTTYYIRYAETDYLEASPAQEITIIAYPTDPTPDPGPTPGGDPGTTPGGGSSSGGDSVVTYPVHVEDSRHGGVDSNRHRAEEGNSVTLIVDPDSGYALDELIVTDRNGDRIPLRDKGDGRYMFTMPDSAVTVEATFVSLAGENPFTDVTAGAYYYDAVQWAVENGITGGTTAAMFSPSSPCTRAHAVTFLWRAAGSPAPRSTAMPFADVAESAYYYDAVLWAVENGITQGTTATTFSPNAPCTRAQIVTFLWRAEGQPAADAGQSFADVAETAYYAGAVRWAVENGVTNGTTATTFSPDNTCTRAQIVTFLWRAMA